MQQIFRTLLLGPVYSLAAQPPRVIANGANVECMRALGLPDSIVPALEVPPKLLVLASSHCSRTRITATLHIDTVSFRIQNVLINQKYNSYPVIIRHKCPEYCLYPFTPMMSFVFPTINRLLPVGKEMQSKTEHIHQRSYDTHLS